MHKKALLFVATAVQLLQFLRVAKSLRHRSKMFAILQQLRPETPTELMGSLQDSKLALCMGKIFAGQEIRAKLDPTMRVVYSKIMYLKHIIGSYFTDSKQSNIIVPSYLLLKDCWSQICIYESKKTHIVATRLLNGPSNPKQNKSIFRKIIDFLMRLNLVKETVTEACLPEETLCLVFGKFSKDGNKASCFQPEMIAAKKKTMLNILQNIIRLKKVECFLLSLGLIGSIVLLFITIRKSLQKFTLNKIELRKLFVKSRFCTDCKQELSCVVNQSCRHLTLCNQCMASHQDCPECHAKSDNIQFFVC